MAIPQGAIMEVRLGYRVSNQQCFNVFHYYTRAEQANADERTLQQYVIDNYAGGGAGTYGSVFKDVMGNNVVINKLAAQFIYPVRFRATQAEFTTAGAVASPCNAQNVQNSILKYGALGNRRNQGSVHIGGVPDSAISGGRVTVAQMTALATVKDFLAAEIDGGAFVGLVWPCILNRTKVVVDGKEKWVISGATEVDTWLTSDLLRTQRTRTVGRGI